MLPFSIMDDIRAQHVDALDNREVQLDVLTSYYFYSGLMHDYIHKFIAKNHQYPINHWKSLFVSFEYLRILNLSRSCCDEILELIPESCPNVEFLNATCRYRLQLQSPKHTKNAATYSLQVSDVGLLHLRRCTKLKRLIINEARSQGRGHGASISHVGFRRLLRGCRSLEDISYSDIGGVIGKSMTMIDRLNLKCVRHCTPTDNSIKEIFRLCPDIEHLGLMFFGHLKRKKAIVELVKCSENSDLQNLYSIELYNTTFKMTQFEKFYTNLGANLKNLTITNNHESTSFNELLIIAQHCPNLTELRILSYSSSKHENHQNIPPNFGQFHNLESLCLTASDSFSNYRKVLKFCTENATKLKLLDISDQHCSIILLDTFFGGHVIKNYELEHIEISSNYQFTKLGIELLIEDYPKLKTLIVACSDRCDDLVLRLKKENYNFHFVNKTFVGLGF